MSLYFSNILEQVCKKNSTVIQLIYLPSDRMFCLIFLIFNYSSTICFLLSMPTTLVAPSVFILSSPPFPLLLIRCLIILFCALSFLLFPFDLSQWNIHMELKKVSPITYCHHYKVVPAAICIFQLFSRWK